MVTDTQAGARTIEENVEISSLPKARLKFNVSRAPIFPTIPLTNVVIDNLHLFLRVSDVLIRLLIDEFKRQDAISSARKFNESFDASKYKHCKGLEDFICTLGIPNIGFYVGWTSRILKVRTLSGPEKLKVLQNIDIQSLLPSMPSDEIKWIQWLWTELLKINRLLSKI